MTSEGSVAEDMTPSVEIHEKAFSDSDGHDILVRPILDYPGFGLWYHLEHAKDAP